MSNAFAKRKRSIRYRADSERTVDLTGLGWVRQMRSMKRMNSLNMSASSCGKMKHFFCASRSFSCSLETVSKLSIALECLMMHRSHIELLKGIRRDVPAVEMPRLLPEQALFDFEYAHEGARADLKRDHRLSSSACNRRNESSTAWDAVSSLRRCHYEMSI